MEEGVWNSLIDYLTHLVAVRNATYVSTAFWVEEPVTYAPQEMQTKHSSKLDTQRDVYCVMQTSWGEIGDKS